MVVSLNVRRYRADPATGARASERPSAAWWRRIVAPTGACLMPASLPCKHSYRARRWARGGADTSVEEASGCPAWFPAPHRSPPSAYEKTRCRRVGDLSVRGRTDREPGHRTRALEGSRPPAPVRRSPAASAARDLRVGSVCSESTQSIGPRRCVGRAPWISGHRSCSICRAVPLRTVYLPTTAYAPSRRGGLSRRKYLPAAQVRRSRRVMDAELPDSPLGSRPSRG